MADELFNPDDVDDAVESDIDGTSADGDGTTDDGWRSALRAQFYRAFTPGVLSAMTLIDPDIKLDIN
jgi:hypothetical protein